MKIAVMSDIHSNYHAFRACYADAVLQKAERFIFLGDYVSDMAEPQKTMDLVYEIRANYPTICLRGNREAYMLDCAQGVSHFSRGSKTGSLLFTYEHLREKDLDFFRSLKISDRVEVEGTQIEIAHALPENDRFYFDDRDGNIQSVFAQMQGKFLLTGHSHKQFVQRNDGKTIINPGSVGIPQGGTRLPKYAVLEIANGEISCVLREVPYDFADAIHAQYASGLVEYAKYWAVGILYDILTGDEWVMKLLKCVQEADAPHDESAWHSAALALGMKFTEQDIMEFYNGKNVILVCGLNGVGKSMLGKALAQDLHYRFVDIEDIYFSKQDNPDYPYEKSRPYEETVSLLTEMVGQGEPIVLASVTGHFGDAFLSCLKCAICVEVPREIRLKRVYDRSYQLFGQKSTEGGAFYPQIQAFHAFCESRDEQLVENWLTNTVCPVIRVDGTLPIDENVRMIVKRLRLGLAERGE